MRQTDTVPRTIRRPRLWYVTTVASIAVGILPIWALERWFGVPRKIIVGYGFLAYIVGVTFIKVPVHHFLVEPVLRPRLSALRLAAIQGFVSAVSELGAAAAFFVYVLPHLTYWQLIGFGVGAGAVEAIMLPFISNPFQGTKLGEHADEVFRSSAGDWRIQSMSVVERVWAMLLHVSTRGLVYLSIAGQNPLAACVAVGGFGAVDGSAYYWHLKKWRFDSPVVLARVHVFMATAACTLMAVFLLWAAHFPFTGR